MIVSLQTVSLERERLQPGDCLLIKEGKLPPKGYLRLSVSLFSPSSSSSSSSLLDYQPGMLASVVESMKGQRSY